MIQPKSLLLYQDEPAYGTIIRVILTIVPLVLLGFSVYLWTQDEKEGSLVLLLESLFVGLIFWAVFPRKYQVYEDQLRIALGGPLAIKIGFEKISRIEVTSRTTFTVNYVTRLTNKYVIITKKKGLSVAITPKSNDAFVENANRALTNYHDAMKR